MKRAVLTMLMLLVTAACFAAAANDSLWATANARYAQKQYDSAAACYERIAVAKPSNAEVYYNLGNTYYRLNKVPQAVLNYERALRIAPEYQAAKDNLALAQSRISTHIHKADDIFFMQWWHNTTRPDKATQWAMLALIAFVLVIVLMLARRLGAARLPVQLPGIVAFLWLCLLALAITAASNSVTHNTAVVMMNDAPLMTREQKGKPLALVPEGITVRIRSEQGAWAEVTLPDGRTGWVQQNTLEKI